MGHIDDWGPHGKRHSKELAYRRGDSIGNSYAVDPLAKVKALGQAMRDAADPSKAPGKVRRLGPDEIAALNATLKSSPKQKK